MNEVPNVILEIDKPRRWQLDGNALIALHEEIGENALQLVINEFFITKEQKDALDRGEKMPDKPLTKARFMMLRALVFCGLVSDDPKLTAQQLGAMIRPTSYSRLLGQITPVLDESMTMGKEEAPEAPAEAPATQA